MAKSIGSPAREAFKRNLAYYMKMRGIEQSDIVSRMDLTASTVSDWCNGKKYPRVDSMQRLADLLGVLMSDLTSEDAPTVSWYIPLIESYQASPEPTQRNVCKLLDIKHVQAPKPAPSAATDEPADETDIGYDTIAAHADGLDRDAALAEIDAAVAALKKKYGR